jgi:hypothetical protein
MSSVSYKTTLPHRPEERQEFYHGENLDSTIGFCVNFKTSFLFSHTRTVKHWSWLVWIDANAVALKL